MNIEKIKTAFNTYFVNVVKTQYKNFKGRATRSQYWYYVLCYFIVSIPFAIIDSVVFHRQILGLILGLALLLPTIAIGVRRLHDLGKPGWWFLMVLIPLAGPIALLVLFCMKSEDKNNQFGNKISA